MFVEDPMPELCEEDEQVEDNDNEGAELEDQVQIDTP